MHKVKIIGQLNVVNDVAMFVNSPETPKNQTLIHTIRSVVFDSKSILAALPYINIRDYDTKRVVLMFESPYPITFKDDCLYSITSQDKIIALRLASD